MYKWPNHIPPLPFRDPEPLPEEALSKLESLSHHLLVSMGAGVPEELDNTRTALARNFLTILTLDRRLVVVRDPALSRLLMEHKQQQPKSTEQQQQQQHLIRVVDCSASTVKGFQFVLLDVPRDVLLAKWSIRYAQECASGVACHGLGQWQRCLATYVYTADTQQLQPSLTLAFLPWMVETFHHSPENVNKAWELMDSKRSRPSPVTRAVAMILCGVMQLEGFISHLPTAVVSPLLRYYLHCVCNRGRAPVGYMPHSTTHSSTRTIRLLADAYRMMAEAAKAHCVMLLDLDSYKEAAVHGLDQRHVAVLRHSVLYSAPVNAFRVSILPVAIKPNCLYPVNLTYWTVSKLLSELFGCGDMLEYSRLREYLSFVKGQDVVVADFGSTFFPLFQASRSWHHIIYRAARLSPAFAVESASHWSFIATEVMMGQAGPGYPEAFHTLIITTRAAFNGLVWHALVEFGKASLAISQGHATKQQPIKSFLRSLWFETQMRCLYEMVCSTTTDCADTLVPLLSLPGMETNSKLCKPSDLVATIDAAEAQWALGNAWFMRSIATNTFSNLCLNEYEYFPKWWPSLR